MTFKQIVNNIRKRNGLTRIYSGICNFCGKDFFHTHKRTSCCSQECGQKRGAFIKCVNCKKQKWKAPKVILRAKNHYCSDYCKRIYEIGENSPSFKGGYISHHGYRVFNVPKSSGKNRTIAFEHRLIMEKILGRTLKNYERVHHSNGIRSDNRPENLELWTVRKDPCGQRVSDILKFVKDNYHNEYMSLCK